MATSGKFTLGTWTYNSGKSKLQPAFKWSISSFSSGKTTLTLTPGYGSKSNNMAGAIYYTVTCGGVTILNNVQVLAFASYRGGSETFVSSAKGSGRVGGGNQTLTIKVTHRDQSASGPYESKQYSFTLGLPSAPVGNPTGSTSVSQITQTTAYRHAVVGSWGSNASAGTWTWTYGIGQYNLSSGGSTNTTLTNLQPDTTYSYKFYIKNGQGKTATYTGTFRTLAYTKPSASISTNSITNTSITFNYSTSGSSISQFRIYVNGSLYTTIYTSSASGTFTLSGLSPKMNYNVYIQAYTPVGGLWGNNSNSLSVTTYPNPVSVQNATITELLPFNARVAVTSSNAGDTVSYGFTLLNSSKGVIKSEVVQSSATYNFTGLTPETTYYARVRVRTKNSNIWSGYVDIQFTTPPDQATIFLKINNIWRRGKMWIKIKGSWIKAKNAYIKVNGSWRKNNNN